MKLQNRRQSKNIRDVRSPEKRAKYDTEVKLDQASRRVNLRPDLADRKTKAWNTVNNSKIESVTKKRQDRMLALADYTLSSFKNEKTDKVEKKDKPKATKKVKAVGKS